MSNITWYALILAASTTSCSNAPQPVETEEVRAKATVATNQVSMIRGYTHRQDTSRFAIGENVREANDNGHHKWIGSNGVFAIDAVNGATAAIPNGDSSVFSQTRFSLSGDEHGKRVREYFVASGLPTEQIGLVQNLSQVEGGGPVGATASSVTDRQFKAYYTVLTRQLSGIPLPDSHAWAAFTDSGDVIAEAVHWPDVPSDVVAQAQAFAATMASDEGRAAFLASQPPAASTGMVVVRHGTRVDRDAPFAVVAWDYNQPVSGPSGATSSIQIHLDQRGNMITLRRDISLEPAPLEQKKQ